ncbi:ComF family protein [Desulforudis sp. 1088]|uniref:ComF family protein n=2 Tax=Candidatus Desulforudis TaxID=471826 RepID=UPI003CE4AC1E
MCRECVESLAALAAGSSRCAVCGRFAVVSLAGFCDECPGQSWPFVFNRASFPYEGRARETVHQLKYHGRRHLASFMAGLMLKTFQAEEGYLKAELLVPVPMGRERLRERRFNQAELLAAALGGLSGLPAAKVLVRARETPPQTGLSRAQRRRNMAGAFAVASGSESFVRGRTVVVVDDVFTTGSTMASAARALKRAGAGRVLGLTFAGGNR